MKDTLFELHRFIGNTPFDRLEDLLKPLKINIKHHKKLYMLYFDNTADFNDIKVRQANGCIFEKDTNDLVHFSFEKSYDDLLYDENYSKSSLYNNTDYMLFKNIKDYKIELYFDGSLIKLYYYSGEWCMSTSRHFEANNNYWASKKSFKDIFIESLKYSYNITNYEDFLNTLDPEFCYTYLLHNNENSFVDKTNQQASFIYIINKINLTTFIEERIESTNLEINLKLTDINRKNTSYMLYIIDNNSTKRVKLLSDRHLKLKQLQNNYPDIGLTYISYYSNTEQQKNLINMFPNYKDKFLQIDEILITTSKYIYNIYLQVYIYKNNINIPKSYQQTIRQLHGQYKKTKKRINIEDVYTKLYELKPQILANIIKYKY